jgi:aminopeptidase-like protein
MIGQQIHQLAQQLWPICRSLTGNGVRETFSILGEHLQGLNVHEVPTGTKAFDWTVPQEWNIVDAYIKDSNGNKIVDFNDSNLHVVGYSTPIHQTMSLDQLKPHLYSLPKQLDAIPYITSYYSKHWGFCLTQTQLDSLLMGDYEVCIDSSLKDGHLTYAELLLPGESKQEVFLSTYICHPSMANNELSGPTVTTFLAKWLMSLPKRKYSYRIVFIPENIGSIVYLSRHLEQMKVHTIAGFNITCIGDERAYSFMPSRAENTLSDLVAEHILKHCAPDYVRYPFIEGGSDERRYCSPGVDLPIVSIMRSKYGCYPEYHTSLDDLSLVTPQGLQGGYEVLRRSLECIESNKYLKVTATCEPQLSKRGLYPSLSNMKEPNDKVRDMMNLIIYSDGTRSLVEIANKIDAPVWSLYAIVEQLIAHDLLTANDSAY